MTTSTRLPQVELDFSLAGVMSAQIDGYSCLPTTNEPSGCSQTQFSVGPGGFAIGQWLNVLAISITIFHLSRIEPRPQMKRRRIWSERHAFQDVICCSSDETPGMRFAHARLCRSSDVSLVVWDIRQVRDPLLVPWRTTRK